MQCIGRVCLDMSGHFFHLSRHRGCFYLSFAPVAFPRRRTQGCLIQFLCWWGTLLWQVFADSVDGPLKAVANSRSMLSSPPGSPRGTGAFCVLVTLFKLVVRLGILIPALCLVCIAGAIHAASVQLDFVSIRRVGPDCMGYAIGMLLSASQRCSLQRHLAGPADNPVIFWMLLLFPCGHDTP